MEPRGAQSTFSDMPSSSVTDSVSSPEQLTDKRSDQTQLVMPLDPTSASGTAHCITWPQDPWDLNGKETIFGSLQYIDYNILIYITITIVQEYSSIVFVYSTRVGLLSWSKKRCAKTQSTFCPRENGRKDCQNQKLNKNYCENFVLPLLAKKMKTRRLLLKQNQADRLLKSYRCKVLRL